MDFSATETGPKDRWGFDDPGGKDPGLAVPMRTHRDREKKWMHMLQPSKWQKYSNPANKKYYQRMKYRARKGIPDSMRGRAWMALSGGDILKERARRGQITVDGRPIRFDDLEKMECPDDWRETIEKDLHRQFPDHEMFQTKGNGQQDLFRVLKAWVLYNPRVGYCQGQAPVAALLLMNLTAEDAFWSLVSICEYFIPGYYEEGLAAIQIDGMVLEGMLKRHSSDSYKLLKKTGMEPVLYMTEWFMCCFIRNLPWQTVLRIFDIFLAEGVKVLFRCAITFVHECLSVGKLKDMSDVMAALKTHPNLAKDESKFAAEVIKRKVSEQELTKEYQKQKKKWEKMGRPEVVRNYFRRVPEDDEVTPKSNGTISGVNSFSTDSAQLNASNVRSKEKLGAIEESPNSSGEDRWQAVSSANFKSVTRTEL